MKTALCPLCRHQRLLDGSLCERINNPECVLKDARTLDIKPVNVEGQPKRDYKLLAELVPVKPYVGRRSFE